MSHLEPKPLGVVWMPEAQADVRAIDRETALGILHCLDRYLRRREGDVQKLKPPYTGLRLRCGDYRLFFHYTDPDTIRVTAVCHRREAYR